MCLSGLSDERFMTAAVALAKRGHGNVSPNPAVGCVIARDGRVIGRGWTQPGGRPHAETVALGHAGDGARGATAYVTLEPCAHHGQTPPCADVLIEAGIARVVVGVRDPDPRVDGAGLRRLEDAGIETSLGVCAEAAREVTADFLMRVEQGRPLVTVKLATSLDGRIATSTGESRWITGPMARDRVHGLRARSDAILVGNGTAIADDPALTCRLPGLGGSSPIRVVLGGRTPLPASHRLVATARDIPTWLVIAEDGRQPEALAEAGVEIVTVAGSGDGRPDPGAALEALGDRGVNRLMVEGGGRTIAALIARDLVDRIVWYRAPVVIGADGTSAVSDFGLERLDDARNFVRLSSEAVGPDLVETYERVRREN